MILAILHFIDKMAASKGTRVCSIYRPNLFADKVAIVTGGATGIGKAITQELLFLGIYCNVYIAFIAVIAYNIIVWRSDPGI